MPLDSVVSHLRFMILGSGLCVVGSVGGVQCDLGILRLAVGNRSEPWRSDRALSWGRLKSKRTMFVTESIFDHSKGD